MMHPAAGRRLRPGPPPPPPGSKLPKAVAPGPARLGAAVDVIVEHLRRLVLLQAWARWQPELSQGEVASRILERQRLRLEEGDPSNLHPHTTGGPRQQGLLGRGKGKLGDTGEDNGGDDKLTRSTPQLGRVGGGVDVREPAVGASFPLPGAGARRGRSHLRPPAAGRPATSTNATAADYSPLKDDDDDGGCGRGDDAVRSLSSPVAFGTRDTNTNGRFSYSNSSDNTARRRGPADVDGGGGGGGGGGLLTAACAEATTPGEVRRLGASKGAVRSYSAGPPKKQQPQASGGDVGNGVHDDARPFQSEVRATTSKNATPRTTITRTMSNGGGVGKTSMLTMQTCFKEEREAFIRDLQVLHRQLEAKDRDHARREKEGQSACARARSEARATKERAVALREEIEAAVAARAEAEARARVATEGLDRQAAAAEILRTRLRHTERLHKEQMDVERRQQAAAAEEASAERRRLEHSALTARQALSDGRRDWAAENDTLLAAVREAGHRADLACGESADATSRSALLEERLQQTLEREASLNEEVERLAGAARDGERRAARAAADAERARAAAAAQEEAYLESVKGLEDRAARAEMMQGGERATREDMHTLLEEAREGALATSSEAQRELSAANLRAVALGQEISAAKAEAESFRLRAVAAEARAGSADASTRDLSARLEEVLSENRRLAAAAAAEKERLEGQWRRREERWRLALVRARRGEEKPGGETEGADNGDEAPGFPVDSAASSGGRREEGRDAAADGREEGTGMSPAEVLEELEELREAVMRLSIDKEHLLGEVSRLTAATATPSTTGITTAQGLKGPEEGDHCGARRLHRRGSVEWGANDPDACHAHPDPGGQGCEGGVRRDAEGEEESERRHRGGWAREGEGEEGGEEGQRIEEEEEEEEEEALLMPRAGPAPMPSRLAPRSGAAAGLKGGGGDGGGGKSWACARPAGRPVAAAALLRSSLERERTLRGREHESLLALLREEGVVAAAAAVDDDYRRRRRPTPLRGDYPLDDPLRSKASPPAGPQRRHEQQRRREDESHADDEPGRQEKEGGVLDESGEEGCLGEGPSATALASASAAPPEGRAATPETPLDGEAWGGVLSDLEAFLRLHRGCRRSRDEGSDGSSADDVRDHRRRGHQERERSPPLPPAITRTMKATTAPVGVHSRSPVGRCSNGRCAGGSGGGRGHRGGDEEAEFLTHSLGSRGSSSPSGRALFSADEDSDGNLREGGRGGPSSRSPPRRRRPSGRREGGSDRGTATGTATQAEADTGMLGSIHGEGGRTGRRLWPASSDEAEDELDEEEEEEGEEIAAAADEVSAFSGALAAALRELLSSTLGVPEETVKGAPLPELVRALQREWEALLEGLSVMQKEVNLARRQARDMAAAAATSPKETPTAVAQRDEVARMKRRTTELEAALADAWQVETGARAAAEVAASEAEDTLKTSEQDRSEATSRLAAALRDLAKERADGAVRLAALTADNRRALSEAEATAAQEAARSAEGFRRSLEEAVRDGERRAEELREAVVEARRRAEMAEGRVRELEEEVAAAREEGGREEGREEGRREAQQRVEALEAALEKLAETGSAAEELSKEQLEITRELSAERDDLMEENERSAARLDQLTTALQEQREEKACVTNKLLDREKGLEALRAEGEIERVKVAKLQEEVGKVQGVCREMTDRLLELQATQAELRVTRQNLERASQELETLRRSKDHFSGGWDEANRLRERLVGADTLCAELSARVAAAEPLVKEESQRAWHLEARVEALQRQLDQVPSDLLVAHAEKRVLQGALDQAKSQASDVQASVAAELRRRDVDARTFASAAALQQEKCGQRLREQALTIHQLTLQGFSAEASSEAQRQRQGGDHVRRPSHVASAAAAGAAGEVPAREEVKRRVLQAPRRGFYRFDGDEDDPEDRGIWMERRVRGRSGSSWRSNDERGIRGAAVLPPDFVEGFRRIRNDVDADVGRGEGAGGYHRGDGRDGYVWAGHSLDSEFRPQRPDAAAAAALDGRESRANGRDSGILDRVSGEGFVGSGSCSQRVAVRSEQAERTRAMEIANRSGSRVAPGMMVGEEHPPHR